jgi:hypothetical protein
MKNIQFTENDINHIRETYSQELERLQKRVTEISSLLKKLKSTEEAERKGNGKKTSTKVSNSLEKRAKQPTTKASKKQTLPAQEEKPKVKRGRPTKIKDVVSTTSAKNESIKTKSQNKIAKKGKPGRKPAVKTVKAVAVKPVKAVKAVKVVKKGKKTKEKTAKSIKAATKPTIKGKPGRKKSENSKRSRSTASIIEILEQKGKVMGTRELIEEVMKVQNIPASEFAKTRSIVAGGLSELNKTKRINSVSVPGQKGGRYGLKQWFNESGKLIDQSRL